MRLKRIFAYCDEINQKSRYADVGCSNGYITHLISERYPIDVAVGYDHSEDHLKIARQRYRKIDFRYLELNNPNTTLEKYDFVTCFETLEHVGNLKAALLNLLNMCKPGGRILINVPIEVGVVGVIKFIVKTVFYGYSLDELTKDRCSKIRYFASLIFTGSPSVNLEKHFSDSAHPYLGFIA
jgi:2-polyprenyl-3-methyl-5-hydroxy-6-metoxy-1,4-benzoquinol methylase